ncbi:GntR family transcriptional regulator [Paenibacillus sp. UNCCL117]|uniref:GntR family transcriptional regulator n=1 Tax=unclassified Paenibacillus TaxID=185978 RepID=UPI0008873964|nr:MULTISPECIES: GntR family transcriptional regulator [unclassified Paenibacillus]SDD96399.1 GntR family transcriptional regulator [Paenibacillus sp. cl123]SFW56396.1 GntR family transcriptional regulator [Paenibacillus sp. UNCCL117]
MIKNRVDQETETPLYVQLTEHFRSMLETGELQPGERFPAELELVKHYGVARITVRTAIAELVQDGMLVRRQGKGTFVAEHKIDRELVNVASFTERMNSRGLRAGSRIISMKTVKAAGKTARLLGIMEGDAVIEIVRLRLSNEVPVALETSSLPADRYPGMEEGDLAEQSLYHLLDSKYGIRPAHSSKTLEMARAESREARLLGVKNAAALFLLTAVVYSEDNRVMEYVHTLFRADRFRFLVH